MRHGEWRWSSVGVPLISSLSCVFRVEKYLPNYVLWIVTTHLLNTLNNYAAAEFETQVGEIVKNENEPQKY